MDLQTQDVIKKLMKCIDTLQLNSGYAQSMLEEHTAIIGELTTRVDINQHTLKVQHETIANLKERVKQLEEGKD